MTDNVNTVPDDQHSPDSIHPDEPERLAVLNPTSGTADHVEDVRHEANKRNYTILETTHEGHAASIAQDAAAGDVDRLAVVGGDGTFHEVVCGLAAASALGGVTLGVIPTGTENIFATAVGVTGITHGFDLLEHGERRCIDVGFAGEEPFVVSCISGCLPRSASRRPAS